MADGARETAATPVAVPAALRSAVAGYRWARDTIGESGAAVYRLHAPGRPDRYLKHGAGPFADDVADEAARLRWFAPRLKVPEAKAFVAAGGEAWLLTTAIAGRTAHHLLAAGARDERVAIVHAIALFLRALHALDVAACPFDATHPIRLAQARRRMEEGLVDESDFGEAHAGWSARAVWEEMTGLLPLAPDPVVTHGDFSLDNILLADGVVTGCIDVGRAGVADRYQDLAILANCLDEFGGGLMAAMFAAYGGAPPDPRKLAFHLCLDEFF